MYRYRVKLTSTRDRGFTVTAPKLPEITTQGESRDDALRMAQDAVDEALAHRVARELDIPAPDAGARGDFVEASTYLVLKVALYEAMRSQSLTKGKLARRLDVAETEVRRILDPHHPTKIQRMLDALKKLGATVHINVELPEKASRVA